MMISNRIVLFASLLAGGAAAAYTIARHSREQEKQQQKTDLRTWEHEGGNLAPSETPPEARPATH
jgi:hypothetical protein